MIQENHDKLSTAKHQAFDESISSEDGRTRAESEDCLNDEERLLLNDTDLKQDNQPKP